MATSRDTEPETGANIHRKRPREAPPQWSPEASQELLRLRYRQLRALFDDAETVADVHEAWGVVASRLNDTDGLLDEAVDAVKCSDQLTRLRQQWQDSSTAQLHLMMAECFSKSKGGAQQQQQQSPPQQQQEPVRRNFNRAMEQAMVQEEESARVEASPKRTKTVETMTESTPQQTETATEPMPLQKETTAVVVATPPPSPPPLQPEPVEASPSPREEVQESSEPASSSPEPISQEEEENELQAEDEEFPRQNEIMRALKRRSEQLEKLAKSHQTLAGATQNLMEALVNRQP